VCAGLTLPPGCKPEKTTAAVGSRKLAVKLGCGWPVLRACLLKKECGKAPVTCLGQSNAQQTKAGPCETRSSVAAVVASQRPLRSLLRKSTAVSFAVKSTAVVSLKKKGGYKMVETRTSASATSAPRRRRVVRMRAHLFTCTARRARGGR